MAAMGAKAAKKPAKKLVDAARAGLGADSDLSRLWNVHAALAAAPEEHRVALAEQVVGEAPPGLARDWLATIATADPAAARGFAARAATVSSGRSFVTDLLTDVASHVEDAELYDALENLIAVRPFAPLFLERGSAIARTRGAREVAEAIDERHRFVAIYAEILNDLRTDAAERLQRIALIALDRLEPDERTAAALWVLTEPNVIPAARRWARIAAFTDPAIDVVTLAWAFNEGTGIHDEEEAELGKRAAAGGPPMLDRASEVLGVAVERGLATAIEHLAPAVPAAFATAQGFAHVLAGIGRGGAVGTRICEEVRAFAHELDDAQAARLVEALLAVDTPGATVTAAIDPHALGRAFFYLQHPGAVPALAAALQRPLSDAALDHVHDCLAHIDSEPAQLLLLERIYVEHRLVRDLVFSLTRGAIQARHRELLAMLEHRPSVHAAWIALGAQVNWLHRPKATLDIVERVLAWGGAPDADPSKLAYIHGQGCSPRSSCIATRSASARSRRWTGCPIRSRPTRPIRGASRCSTTPRAPWPMVSPRASSRPSSRTCASRAPPPGARASRSLPTTITWGASAAARSRPACTPIRRPARCGSSTPRGRPATTTAMT